MKERLILCVRSEFLGKNYYFDLYVMQIKPLLKIGTSGQFVTCTWRDYAGEIFSKRIAWLFLFQLKMSFNVTGYIDVSFERAKIQSRRLLYLFFWISNNHKHHYNPKKQTFKMWMLARKKLKGLKQEITLVMKKDNILESTLTSIKWSANIGIIMIDIDLDFL